MNGGWGIVRYAKIESTDLPGEELCVFDGWYANQSDADVVYRDWVMRFPTWNVCLVTLHEAEGRMGKWPSGAN